MWPWMSGLIVLFRSSQDTPPSWPVEYGAINLFAWRPGIWRTEALKNFTTSFHYFLSSVQYFLPLRDFVTIPLSSNDSVQLIATHRIDPSIVGGRGTWPRSRAIRIIWSFKWLSSNVPCASMTSSTVKVRGKATRFAPTNKGGNFTALFQKGWWTWSCLMLTWGRSDPHQGHGVHSRKALLRKIVIENQGFVHGFGLSAWKLLEQ